MPKGIKGFQKGHIVSEETRKKIGDANRGENSSRYGIKASEETRRKMSKKVPRGKKCHFWRGGISKFNESMRHSLEYKLWREAVFARDNWACRFCGQRGGELNADHIKPFADYPELRFAIDNGRTLCKECHKKTDTYGKRVIKII